MARIHLESVSKSFSVHNGRSIAALREVSLEIEEGEFLVLVGPSGCGKTTLLRLIAGLESPDAGSVAFDGQSMNSVPAEARDVAMVFQNHALFPHLSVLENLALPLRLRGRRAREIRPRVLEVAEGLELAALLDRAPAALSGGERQRVALGRALITQPRVLLLDEPLSHLDPPLRRQMQQEWRKWHRRLGTTMVFVTHDQAEALALGCRVAVMGRGRMHQVAAPRKVYREPATRWVAEFFGSPPMNLIAGELACDGDGMWYQASRFAPGSPTIRFRVGGDGLESGPPRAVILGIRPEDIHLEARPGSRGQPLVGRLERIDWLGAETLLYADCGEWSLAIRCSGNPPPSAAPEIRCWLDVGQGSLFDAESGNRLEVELFPGGQDPAGPGNKPTGEASFETLE